MTSKALEITDKLEIMRDHCRMLNLDPKDWDGFVTPFICDTLEVQDKQVFRKRLFVYEIEYITAGLLMMRRRCSECSESWQFIYESVKYCRRHWGERVS